MKALIVVLVVLWLAVSLAGVLIEGLLWLFAIGLLLALLTGAYGWFKLRGLGKNRSRSAAR